MLTCHVDWNLAGTTLAAAGLALRQERATRGGPGSTRDRMLRPDLPRHGAPMGRHPPALVALAAEALATTPAAGASACPCRR